MKNIEVDTVANRRWMLHEHHGWTCLAESYGGLAEYNAACEAQILNAANQSDSRPILFDRDEFLRCEYYEDCHAELSAKTTHIIATGCDDIAQYPSQAEADLALDEAMREHGYARLTCDRGGHSGRTERTDISDISVTVTTPSGVYRFNFEDADDELSAEDLEYRVPESEQSAVRTAVESALAAIAAEVI